MQRCSDLSALGARPGPIALAAGYMDGVHLGHRAVLEAAVEEARRRAGEAWVLTFDPHPGKVLRPEAAPPLLTDLGSRLDRIAGTGVDGTVLLPFTPELSGEEPGAFLRGLAARAPGVRVLVVGENWRFGRAASGDVGALLALAGPLGLEVRAVAPVLWDGAPVSSSRIRRAVEEGDMAAAAAMLGRPFSLRGPVLSGRALGRQLGFPTANLDPLGEVRPPPGVYAAEVDGLGPRRGAVAYYGTRPTFGPDRPPELEVHVLDLDGSLYGRDLEVRLLARIRGQRVFTDPAGLAAQIRRDIVRVREVLARGG